MEFSDKKCAKQIGKKMFKKVYNFGANKFDNCVMFSRKDLDLRKQSIFTTSKTDRQLLCQKVHQRISVMKTIDIVKILRLIWGKCIGFGHIVTATVIPTAFLV